MSVAYRRKEFEDQVDCWKRIDNVVSGRNVKQYLRKLQKIGTGAIDDLDRQKQYEESAIFYAVAGHTLKGLVGTGFRKDPTFDPPARLRYLLQNADGAGNGIHQQARGTLAEVLKKGRAGLWVDYPEVEGEVSRAEINRFFATVHRIEAEQIINWRTRADGANTKLELVVIHSCEDVVSEDGFELNEREIITVLGLTEGGDDEPARYYTQRHIKIEKTEGKTKFEWRPEPAKFPADADGNPLQEIPFTFVGAENNDSRVDESPMEGLVEINVGHYRNSADFEDSVFYSGQSQPWLSGMDQALVEMFKENDIRAGSRYIMPVPAGEQFGFATPDPNPVVRQAMGDKVELMIGIGAKFIVDGGPAKTATEASQDEDAQTSVLSNVVGNVADAYTRTMVWVALFMGVDAPEYQLDNDFSDFSASPELFAKWVESYLKGAVPEADYIRWMQRQGYFDTEKTVEEISDELNPSEPEGHGDEGGNLPGDDVVDPDEMSVAGGNDPANQ